MSGCHYTGCVDLNIPCSLAHLSFSVVVICEVPLLTLKSQRSRVEGAKVKRYIIFVSWRALKLPMRR